MYLNKILATIYILDTILAVGVYTEKLQGTCAILESGDMDHLCTSRYPESLLIIYGDRLAEANDLFSVYRFRGEQNRYFVSIKSSRLHNCKSFKIIDSDTYTCVRFGENTAPISITLPAGGVRCIGVHFRLGDALLKHCFRVRKIQRNVVKNSFVAFHYADVDLYKDAPSDIDQLQPYASYAYIWMYLLQLLVHRMLHVIRF